MTMTTTLMCTFTFFKCDSIVIAERRPLKTLHIQKIQKASGIDDQVCADLMDMSKYWYIVKIMTISIMFIQLSQALVARNYHNLSPPLFSNFLFTYLFSKKILYFVIIKFHLFFPYFTLFVSISIQSYVFSNYRVSILYLQINTWPFSYCP